MATDVAKQRFQTWYAMLLRLYPRPFRERFGTEMAQAFQDLCREQRDAGLGLHSLALWVYFETLMGAIMENATQMQGMGKTLLRVALVSLGLLMVPLVASRVVDGWNWSTGSFVFVYVLFFGIGMAYTVIARRMGEWSYKAAVGISLVAAFALGWSNLVQVADSGHPENLAYQIVLVVGLAGALLSRLKARGLAFTLFAMAATLAVIAVMLTSLAPSEFTRNMAIGRSVFVALFIASGLLFRHASLSKAN